MPSLPVAVVSDVIRPWCFVGKRHLEAARRMRPEVQLEVEWRPFLLDPQIPEGGVDREERLLLKFGSRAALDAVHDRLSDIGAEAGIQFQWQRMSRTANTISAHRLLKWAAQVSPETQDDVQEALFRATFEEGRDVGDLDVLAAIAGAAGMDAAAVRTRLGGDDDRAAVLQEAQSYPRAGISGVPFFVFGDPERGELVACSGAQRPEVLARAIDAALEQASQPIAAPAGACDDDECAV